MKLVNKKEDLRNQYGNYDGNTIVGKYSQNQIKLKPQDIGDITSVSGDFRVIYSIDGQLFGSSTYLSEIRNSNNPYITKSTLPIIEFNSSDLINATDFKFRENYSEATVTSTLENVSDLSKHIAWLLDKSQQELRKPSIDYGSYSIAITEYNSEIDEGDNSNPGMGFQFSKQAQTPIE
jgi:hypothetical protein